MVRIKKVSSFESNGNIQKKVSGSYCAMSDTKSSSVTLNKLAIDARGVYCNFVISIQGSLFQRLFKLNSPAHGNNNMETIITYTLGRDGAENVEVVFQSL